MELYQYQSQGVDRAVCFYGDGRHGVINGDDPGLGKTAQSVVIANELRASSVLVVCPSSVKLHWISEFKKWSVADYAYHLISGRGGETMTAGFNLVAVVNYDILQHTDFSRCEYDLVIYDEAHFLKTATAKRSKVAAKIPAKNRLLLTGTPIQNRPIEIFNLLCLCGVCSPKDYHKFGMKYCAGFKEWIYIPGGNGKKKQVWNFSGASNLEELNYWLSNLCLIRRRKREVLADLPECTRQMIELDSSHRPANYDASKLNDDIQIAFGEYSLVRHEEALALLPQFIEIVQNELRSTDKLFIAFYHRDIGEGIRDSLRDENSVKWHDPSMVWGGMTAAQKQTEVDRFVSSPEVHVFLGQINASGTGTDGLQHVCSNMLVLEFPWDPGTRDQLEARLDRNGQTMPVLVRYLVHNGSLSARIAKTILRKEDVINKAVNQ